MQKSIQIIFLALLIVLPFTARAYAADTVEINQLIEQENRFNRTQVVVQGEAIGEPMERGDTCWVNLNDGTNAIGIKMKTSDARRIAMFGNYRQKGDTVRVTGTFYKACAEDGGETDIHAVSLEIISPGRVTERPLDSRKAAAAVSLAVLTALCLAALKHKKIDRLFQRKGG